MRTNMAYHDQPERAELAGQATVGSRFLIDENPERACAHVMILVSDCFLVANALRAGCAISREAGRRPVADDTHLHPSAQTLAV